MDSRVNIAHFLLCKPCGKPPKSPSSINGISYAIQERVYTFTCMQVPWRQAYACLMKQNIDILGERLYGKMCTSDGWMSDAWVVRDEQSTRLTSTHSWITETAGTQQLNTLSVSCSYHAKTGGYWQQNELLIPRSSFSSFSWHPPNKRYSLPKYASHYCISPRISKLKLTFDSFKNM